MILAPQIKYPKASRYVYPQNCSIHTPLQKYASIPFKHIEPKHNNKPEVNYIKQGVLLQNESQQAKTS